MSVETRVLPPRYTDLQEIGRGGMGRIYVAHDGDLKRTVAIKLLDEELARDPSIHRRFMREARAAARLSGHEHIITIYDVGEWNGRPFIVMEHLSGGTLAKVLRTRRPERGEMLAWLEQAASAIDCAHREGVVHRDIKPANLLFDRRGELHVADFGIARVADETTGMTLAGTVLGTAGYLAPEQARGEPATPASDVYALAVVAYELLTGARPFERGTATAEAAAHIHEPVPAASERGEGIPREVDAVFERALAKDASRRYGTASDFVRALRAALEPVAAPTRVLTAPVPRERREEPAAIAGAGPRRSHALPVAAAVALAALAFAGVVAAAFFAGDDGERTAATNRAAPSPAERVTVTHERTITTPGQTQTQTVVATAEPPPAAPPPPAVTQPAEEISVAEAVQLTDQATGLMRQGDYTAALPLALKALERLDGSGHNYEAYANYDVGKSLAELGKCRQALPYLERREEMLGPHPDVTAAKRRCGA